MKKIKRKRYVFSPLFSYFNKSLLLWPYALALHSGIGCTKIPQDCNAWGTVVEEYCFVWRRDAVVQWLEYCSWLFERWINHYTVDSVVCFVNNYPLDSDLSTGMRIQPSNNRGLNCTSSSLGLSQWLGSLHFVLGQEALLYLPPST